MSNGVPAGSVRVTEDDDDNDVGEVVLTKSDMTEIATRERRVEMRIRQIQDAHAKAMLNDIVDGCIAEMCHPQVLTPVDAVVNTKLQTAIDRAKQRFVDSTSHTDEAVRWLFALEDDAPSAAKRPRSK